jgi:hypothetical protein
MRVLALFPIITILIVACPFNHASVAQQRWVTYTNPRFGTTADYPADLFTVLDPPPENGDGQGFRTPDGRARLSIYGTWNVERDTPQTYFSRNVDLAGTNITYKRVTDHFYVASGKRQGKIFYDRCNFSRDPEGIIDCLSISYPEQEKAAWNSIVSHLSGSLRAKQGDEPRK